MSISLSVYLFFTATVCEVQVVRVEGKYSSSTCKCEVLVKTGPGCPSGNSRREREDIPVWGFSVALKAVCVGRNSLDNNACGKAVYYKGYIYRSLKKKKKAFLSLSQCRERTSTESSWHVSGSLFHKDHFILCSLDILSVSALKPYSAQV